MLKPGTIIGDRYEILETVGSGGMSIVYKAKCHKLNRYVAIKMLKPEFSDDKGFVTKFRVEAQSAACLSHPNVVSVFDVGEDDGMYYIVMELVEGITLKEYIERQGRLSVEQALNFSLQIASGIEVAHDNHIIHRDIKPQNIIVSRNGTLKVTDFGIARAATSNTISPTAMGSVHYISPEQARGGFSDERSDIYSLGITMFEMLTGRVPFEGDNNVTVALMHIQDEMASPRAYYPDIPVSLEKIIFKCTQKRAERRYLTANALIADLKKVAANPFGDLDVGVMTAYSNGPTVMMTEEELNAIKYGASQKPAQEPEQLLQVPEVNSHRDIQSRLDNIMEEDRYGIDDEPGSTGLHTGGHSPNAGSEDEIDIDDDEAISPELEKAVMVGGIVVAVLLCIFAMIGINKMTGWFKFGNANKSTTTEASTDEPSTEVSVPMINVVGLTQAEAETKLKGANIDFYTIQFEESDEVESGTVISQSANEGDMVSPSSNLVITVSSGTQSVPVPDVTGKSSKDAADELVAAGFETQFAYEYNDEVEKDKVISTNPAAGSSAPAGSKVIITVSNGKEFVEAVVPDLRGLTKKQAEKELKKAGLELGEVTEEYSDEVPEGQVIRQSTSANTTVQSGNKVDITISKGPEAKTTSYTASFSGTIENSSYTFAEGETATVKLVFKYDGGKVSYTLLEGVYDGASFPISLSKVKKISGLATNSGEIALTVISSNGTDISASFSASSVSITYKEVTE